MANYVAVSSLPSKINFSLTTKLNFGARQSEVKNNIAVTTSRSKCSAVFGKKIAAAIPVNSSNLTKQYWF